jgi:hypothetical protein
MTSLEQELGSKPDLDAYAEILAENYALVLERDPLPTEVSTQGGAAALG